MKKNNFPPFQYFVLQNFPFIEDDFDQLTYYEILCKIIEHLKLTDEQINKIESYLNGLDIQEEVNKKLNEMAEDGTLARIINEEIFGELDSRTSLAGLYMPSLLNSVGSEMISLFISKNKAVLFDTGRQTSVASNKEYLLSKLGERKIDAVFISHYHGDHMGGLEGLKELYSDDVVVYLPLNFIPYYNGTDDMDAIITQRNQVLDFLTTYNINYVEIDTDRTIDFEDFTVSTTNSNTQAYSHYNLIEEDKYNSYSMICTLNYGKTKLLFPGDATVDTQDYLYSQNQVEKVNVLCSFHHGYERYKNTKYMMILNPDFEYYGIAPSSWNSINLLQYDYAFNTKPFAITSQAFNSVEYNISKYGVEFINGNVVKDNMFANKVYNIYVSPSFTGFPDGSESAPYVSIPQALNYLPKDGSTISIHLASGTYTNLRFLNIKNRISFYADENDVVFGDEAQTSQIVNCSSIFFDNIKFRNELDVVDSNAYLRNCDLQCQATTAGNINLKVTRSIVEIYGSKFSNAYTGLYCDYGSFVTSINCEFDITQNAVYVENSVCLLNSYTRTNGIIRKGNGAEIKTITAGNTAGRPSFGVSTSMRGYQYFDTTLGLPIFYYNTNSDERWIDASGNVV